MMLRYCLGSMMAGKPLNSIRFSAEDYENVKHLAASLDRQELEEKLQELLKTLIKQGYRGNRQLYQYLLADIPDFAAALIHGAGHDCIEMVI